MLPQMQLLLCLICTLLTSCAAGTAREFGLTLTFASAVDFRTTQAAFIVNLTEFIASESGLNNNTQFIVMSGLSFNITNLSSILATADVRSQSNTSLILINTNLQTSDAKTRLSNQLHTSWHSSQFIHHKPVTTTSNPIKFEVPLAFIGGWIWLAVVSPGLCVSSCWVTMLIMHCAPESAKNVKKVQEHINEHQEVHARPMRHTDLFNRMQSKKDLLKHHRENLSIIVANPELRERLRNESRERDASAAMIEMMKQGEASPIPPPVPVSSQPLPKLSLGKSNSNDLYNEDMYDSGNDDLPNARGGLPIPGEVMGEVGDPRDRPKSEYMNDNAIHRLLGYQEPAPGAKALYEADYFEHYDDNLGWNQNAWQRNIKRKSADISVIHHGSVISHMTEEEIGIAAETLEAARAAGISIDHPGSIESAYGQLDAQSAEEARMVAEETAVAARAAGLSVYAEDMMDAQQYGNYDQYHYHDQEYGYQDQDYGHHDPQAQPQEHSRSHSSDLFNDDHNDGTGVWHHDG